MAVTLLKRSRQIFDICSRQISSRCLQASAAIFRNFAAASDQRRVRKKASSLGWADLEDIRIRTKDKARGRKSKKSNAIAKNRVRERRSTSPPKYSDITKLSKISRSREGRPNSPQASDTTKRGVIGRKSSSLPKSDATQSKDRKKRFSSPKKFRDTTKNRIREMRSDRHSRSLEKYAGAAKSEEKAEAKVMTMDREDPKRRRAPEAVMWSARTAETMLLYKDGTDKIICI